MPTIRILYSCISVMLLSILAGPAAKADDRQHAIIMEQGSSAFGVTSSQLLCECLQITNSRYMGLQQCSQRPATYAVFTESCKILWTRHWLLPRMNRAFAGRAQDTTGPRTGGPVAPLMLPWIMEDEKIGTLFMASRDDAIRKAKLHQAMQTRDALARVIQDIDESINGLSR